MQMTRVVIAIRDLPTGTLLREEDLQAHSVPRSGLTGEPVSPDDDEWKRIIGRKIRFPIAAKQPILWTYVDVPNRARSGLSPTISKGSRAISIPVGGVTAVSGLIQPDDSVDVLGTFTLPSAAAGASETVTMTILENVQVLAVGTRLATSPMASRSETASGYSMITLEVSPGEAELLVFAGQMKGKLTLSLRNPSDVGVIEKLDTVDFTHLRDKIPEYRAKRLQRQRPPR